MKEINPNYWAPHNQEWAPHYGEQSAPIPITDLPTLASGDNLYDGFYVYNAGGPPSFTIDWQERCYVTFWMRRTITSMKIINDYNFYYYHYESMSEGLSIYLPTKLDKFYASIVLFYHRLTLLAEDNFYEDS